MRLANASIGFTGPLPEPVRDSLGDLSTWAPGSRHDRLVGSASVGYSEAGWTVTAAPDSDISIGEIGPVEQPADLVDRLVTRFNRLSLDTDPRRLHLHAAAAECEGTGVLLAGVAGSGKSTVVAELVARGARYLTDECVTLTPGSRTVTGYPKPLTLKTASIEYLSGEWAERAEPWAVTAAAALGDTLTAGNGRSHLRASRLTEVAAHSRIGLIVFPTYDPTRPFDLRPLSEADTCVRLLGDSLDAVRLGPAALDAVAQIASGAGCWELTYAHAADAVSAISELRSPLRTSFAVTYRIPGSQPQPNPSRPPQAKRTGTTRVSGPPRPRRRSRDTARHLAWFDSGVAGFDGATRRLFTLSHAEAAAELGSGGDVRSSARPVELSVPGDAPFAGLSFGLPGVPVADPASMPPLSIGEANAAVTGRTTGVALEQILRGRPATDAVEELARRRHRAAQSTCLLLEQALERVVGLLRDADIDPVLLKGPVSAHDTMSPPWFRDFGDLDLLVGGSRIDDAVRVLKAAGFERRFTQISPDFDKRFAKSVTLLSERHGPVGDSPSWRHELDLHRTLTPGPFGHLIDLDALHAEAVPVQINGGWYRALSLQHRFLHAVLHVALGSERPRLNSLRELVATAPVNPDAAHEVLETAAQWHIIAPLQRALCVVEGVFPGVLPPALTARVGELRVSARERVYLASYHRGRWSYALPAVTSLATLPTWRERRDFALAHLGRRRIR